MDTYFAPARRTDRRKIRNQIKDISKSPVMNAVLEVSSGILVVLNQDRQIVALNHVFLEELGLPDIEDVLGLRLGESLRCIHAFKEPSGCGTTEHCETCGAAIAMMSAIDDDIEKEQICALVSDRKGSISDICLKVRAKPITVDGNRWILFYAHDITQQQFWLNMDRVFFHDINNTLTALYGNAQMLQMTEPDNRDIAAICRSIERLVNEIGVQKEFSHHRDAAYTPVTLPVCMSQIKKELEGIISGHKASSGKRISSDWPKEDIILNTDHLLLARVLGNMVINALEATPPAGEIRIAVTLLDNTSVKWEIWNRSHIPAPVQKRIFQRYYSSKTGKGRGLGTYSMKLFGESYLKGKVAFTSSPEKGTTFTFTLPLEAGD
ncbi:MAG: HAMP domain-containing histidine kinase [Desulfobacter sp.]|nr:MAG: HAMP domain-containing histidine kinase [Desulfobacter sp.]